jgi:Reverse transcriptase (RNA-dependent DNA polymerase)/Endonuclease-reverse transcriptase
VHYPVRHTCHKNSKRDIRILYTNAQSIVNKLCDLHLLLRKNLYDVVAIAESWLHKNNEIIKNDIIDVPGYRVFRTDRKHHANCSRGGGVLLYVRESLNAVELIYPHDIHGSDCDSVWCNVNINNSVRFIVGCVYRPPSSSNINTEYIFNQIRDICLAHKNSKVIVLGDFNFPNVNWLLNLFPSNSLGLKSLIEDCLFTQHVSQPTRYSNILDLVMTRCINKTDVNVHYLPPLARSDHVCLEVSVTLANPIEIESNENQRVVQYCYKRADWEAICCDLTLLDWSLLFSSTDVNECWRIFKENLWQVLDKHVPKISKYPRRKRIKPLWLLGKDLTVLKDKKEAWNQYRKTLSPDDLANYKRRRNKAANYIRHLKCSYERYLADNISKNPKSFFAYARSSAKNKPCHLSLTDDNVEIIDDGQISEKFNEYFVSVFTRDTIEPIVHRKEAKHELDLDMVLSSINRTSVEVQLKKLNVNKSAGPDNIPNVVLKETSSVIANLLVHLFKMSVRDGCIPAEWRHAIVVPIHKTGNVNCKTNYRPISLTCTVCKVLESIIYQTLLRYTSEHCPIRDTQYGFRQNRSCASQLIDYINDLTAATDQGLCIDAVYLDFSKAFDKVSHRLLLQKLASRKIPVFLINWISSFLLQRTQSVRVGTVLSAPKAVTSGVPQGSILGPLLFLLFVDDVDSIIEPNTFICKFADDLKLYYVFNPDDQAAVGSNTQNPLQKTLLNIMEWSESNTLPLNLNKCSVLHFGKKNLKVKYMLSQTPLNARTYERDLGILVDDRLSFDQQISTAVSKAKRLVGMMLHTFSSRSRNVILPVFQSLIRPVLEYASPVWNSSSVNHTNQLESVQRYVTKRIVGLSALSYEDRLETLNISTLCARRRYLDLIEMFKIIHGYTFTKCITHVKFVESSTRGHKYRLRKSKSKLKTRTQTFLLRTTNSWNALPAEIVNCKSLNMFKHRLRAHMSV